MSNLLEYENRYYDLGYDYIIGLDEAGRGPMAGELVVAGVIFPKGINSKKKRSDVSNNYRKCISLSH